MSRIGKSPIEIPEGVTVAIDGLKVEAKGKLGELSLQLNPKVAAKQEGSQVLVTVKDDQDKECRSLWGLSRTLIANMILGVTEGFEKKLEVNGVGYKVAVSGSKVVLNVGYSHPVEIELPEGIKAAAEKNLLTISGIDKQLVGKIAAEIRQVRKPEPYKGKGIKYEGEEIRRKAGKAAKAAAE